LDVEFSKEVNPGVDGDDLIRVFVAMLMVEVAIELGVVVEWSHVLQLDSTTAKKFSRHLLVKNVVFEDNAACGHFVHSLAFRIHQEKVRLSCVLFSTASKGPNGTKDTELGRLLVVKEPSASEIEKASAPSTDTLAAAASEDSAGAAPRLPPHLANRKTLIIDLAVYSRNRYFRIYKSTKLDKARPLLLLDKSTFNHQARFDSNRSTLLAHVSFFEGRGRPLHAIADLQCGLLHRPPHEEAAQGAVLCSTPYHHPCHGQTTSHLRRSTNRNAPC